MPWLSMPHTAENGQKQSPQAISPRSDGTTAAPRPASRLEGARPSQSRAVKYSAAPPEGSRGIAGAVRIGGSDSIPLIVASGLGK